MKGFGLYLIILVCLLAGVSYVVSQTQQTETLSYNQIYNYFMDGDVDQYDVDDTTLTMHLKKGKPDVHLRFGRLQKRVL